MPQKTDQPVEKALAEFTRKDEQKITGLLLNEQRRRKQTRYVIRMWRAKESRMCRRSCQKS
jgi:Mrp family chromosome partitioning ATPase